MASIRVFGIEIEMHTWGKGPPLVFLHGEDYFEQHRPFLAALGERGFHVLAPRLPGFGLSPLPAHFRSVDDLAYLVLDLLETLQLDRPAFCGASLGGWVALEVAVRAPERLSRLALLGTVGVKLGGREDRDFYDVFQSPDAERHARSFADPGRSVPDYKSMSEEQLIAVARDRQSAAHFAWRPYMHNPRLRHWLHRVRVPTLVVVGDRDGITAPSYGGALAEMLPSARLETMAGAGHWPQVEQSAETARRVAGFLGQA